MLGPTPPRPIENDPNRTLDVAVRGFAVTKSAHFGLQIVPNAAALKVVMCRPAVGSQKGFFATVKQPNKVHPRGAGAETL
jgi:hypothetical protein